MKHESLDTAVSTLNLGNKEYVVIERSLYNRLRHKGPHGDVPLPPRPQPTHDGLYPALEYADVSLARSLIKRRWSAGLTQTKLAKRAGIRTETLNRIERAKTVPSVATVQKIIRVLEQEENK